MQSNLREESRERSRGEKIAWKQWEIVEWLSTKDSKSVFEEEADSLREMSSRYETR